MYIHPIDPAFIAQSALGRGDICWYAPSEAPFKIYGLCKTAANTWRRMPEDIAEGLRQLERLGHSIAVCSGKPLAYLCGMLRQIGLERPALAGENGASQQLGIDLPPLRRSALPYPEAARRKLDELRSLIDSRFSGRVWYQPNEHMLTCFPHDDSLFEPIAEMIRLAGAVEAGLVVYRHCDCFDIIPEGIDKGAGLRALCSLLCTSPDNTVAVGDHDNDRPMFEAAALSIGVGRSAPPASLQFDTVNEAVRYLLDMPVFSRQ